MTILILFFSGAFGLAVGSFLNVFTMRLMEGERLTGRSHCPRCGYTLAWYDLVPVFSFLWLRGSCRSCHVPISWQYPLVELGTSLAFIVVAASFISLGTNSDFLFLTSYLLLLAKLAFTAGLVALFVFDVRWYVLPDHVTLPLFVIAFAVNLFLGMPILSLAYGVLLGGGFFFVLWAVSRGKWIGSGDIFLGAALGAMVGWPGIVAVLYLAYIFGGATALVLWVSGKAKRGALLPMGAFLTAAAFVVLVFDKQVDRFLSQLF